ncbi:MAG: hypothetical protein WCE63_23975 [Acidobacteriaceae bacterium]
MKLGTASSSRRRFLRLAGMSSLPVFGFMRGALRAEGQDKTDFPEGFDAVEAAPQSHTVLFENSIVRVLQVVVAPGTREPMHHHRWPSIFLNWDIGGRSGHIRIYHADGSIHDVPSRETPIHPGFWRVTWMKPEPMHSIENLESPDSSVTLPQRPPTVRVEFKYTA